MGGAGVAFPAGACTLTIARTFFATELALLRLLYLQEIELHRRLATEHRDEHAQFGLLVVHRVDRAEEFGERSVDDLDPVALVVRDPDLRLLLAHLTQDGLHFGVR